MRQRLTATSAVIMACGALAGCQTTPTAQVQNFVAATSTLAQAEADYFDQIQAASDASHLLTAGSLYVARPKSMTFEEIEARLAKRDDFSRAKAARVAALDQLTNYAKQLSAIAGAGNGTDIGTDAKNVAANTSKLVADATGAKLSTSQAGLLQSAVSALASAIVEAESAREIQTLATQAQQPIDEIARMIGDDNNTLVKDDYIAGLAADQTTALSDMLRTVYQDKQAGAAERLAALNVWRSWQPVLVTKNKDVDNALAKLEAANTALVDGQPHDASTLAREALNFAQSALAAKAPAATAPAAAPAGARPGGATSAHGGHS